MCRSHPLLSVYGMAPGRLLTWWAVGRLVVRGLVYLVLFGLKRLVGCVYFWRRK